MCALTASCQRGWLLPTAVGMQLLTSLLVLEWVLHVSNMEAIRGEVRAHLREGLLSSLKIPQLPVPLAVRPPEGHLKGMLNGTVGVQFRKLIAVRREQHPGLRAKVEYWGWVQREKLDGWMLTTETAPRAGRPSDPMPDMELIHSLGSLGEQEQWAESTLVLIRATILRLQGISGGLPQRLSIQEAAGQAWRNVLQRHLKKRRLTKVSYQWMLQVLVARGMLILDVQMTTIEQAQAVMELGNVGMHALVEEIRQPQTQGVDAPLLRGEEAKRCLNQVDSPSVQEVRKRLCRNRQIPRQASTISYTGIVQGCQNCVPGTVGTPIQLHRRTVVVDLYAGFGSWGGIPKKVENRRRGIRVLTVDRYGSFDTPTGVRHTDAVLDVLTYTDPEPLLLKICDMLQVDPRDVLLFWISLPCDTYSKCDATNTPKGANHREYSKEEWVRDALVGGARRASTPLARLHDSLTGLTLRLMLLLWLQYRIPSVLENPHGSLRLVTQVRSLVLRPQIQYHLTNYCIYDHPYHKLTDLFTTLPELVLRGCTGTGRCTQNCHCGPKWGYINQETLQWNHKHALGREAHREYGDTVVEREYYKNMVPQGLLQEVLDRAHSYWYQGSAGN